MPSRNSASFQWDGDGFFARGVNSQQDPTQLVAGFARSAMNLVNRGGIWQCRPGYTWMFNLPAGEIQGAAMFVPTQGLEKLFFAVNGLIYSSEYPFKEYLQVEGLEFKYDARFIYFCEAEKASVRNSDGSLTLVTPFKVMMIQDGETPPGICDGTTGYHIYDPEQTPIGTVMAWVGGRLWVARRKEIFASDPNDPLEFREGTYMGLAKSFLLDREVTALAPVTYNSGAALLAFTDTSTTAFRADVRRREDWGDPEVKFQRVLFPSIGCISHLSPVTLNGILWWASQFGVTNFDAAMAANSTSKFSYQDGEMADSKGFLSPDVSGIVMSGFENYLLVSVPYTDLYNSHTWVLDISPADSKESAMPEAWNGFWSGTRPVVWVTSRVQGVPRIFQFSKDLDNRNRLWEAFGDEREDHGCAISWALETRGYTLGTIGDKTFRFSDVYLMELLGDIDIAIYVAGTTRGAYRKIMQKRITATKGTIDGEALFDMQTEYFSLKKQSRRVRTVDAFRESLETTSCGVESNVLELTDLGHQLLIVGSGAAAIRGIRMAVNVDSDDTHGECERDSDETGETKAVRFDGAASTDVVELATLGGITTYSSIQSYTITHGALSYTATGQATSIVSQQDADKIALQQAKADAQEWWEDQQTLIVGDPDNPLDFPEEGSSSPGSASS